MDIEKAKSMNLPLPPWTVEALGEEAYCKLALELGFFDPTKEPKGYRPALDPTPYLDVIKAKINNTKEKQ